MIDQTGEFAPKVRTELVRQRTTEVEDALRDFARRFNNHPVIARIGYRTPAAHRRIMLAESA